jgi:hypothetical protein
MCSPHRRMIAGHGRRDDRRVKIYVAEPDARRNTPEIWRLENGDMTTALVLVIVAVVGGLLMAMLLQARGRPSPARHTAADGGGDVSWLPAAVSDSGSASDCSSSDAGCDGGSGGSD